MLTARSKARFPSLAPKGCPWHDDCTPMDCEFFRTVPAYDQYARPQVVSTPKVIQSVPVKRKGRGKK